ncbi:hypothetical protein [Natrialbaceae archaeon AArc-T1-2]|uniref:hypothetical protein n=1 Tax=Natrialbaceae archaeon AArc-T1-2 TaxID=3053904 RepID=UPI00255B2A98|nr:hypothetical protein [Natrialbaceae archaeon AArc-T1-2]WIV66929.1 hypothetical protein QQ977_14745 [Natrialbaceae archaeon AArc-T1-2]
MEWEDFISDFENLPLAFPNNWVHESTEGFLLETKSEGYVGRWLKGNDRGESVGILPRREQPIDGEQIYFIISEDAFIVFEPWYSLISNVVERLVSTLGIISAVPYINDWHPSDIFGYITTKFDLIGIKLSYPIFLLIFFTILKLKGWLSKGYLYDTACNMSNDNIE